MTRYWMKIALGALLIFAVGMAVWVAAKKGMSSVHSVFDTADPISIPIKIVSFRVDGTPLGKIRTIRFLRSAPKQVSSVEVTVRLDSASFADRIRPCTLRIDDVEKIDEHTSFVCVGPDNAGSPGVFEPFGQVLVEGTDIALPLLLPTAAVAGIRNHGRAGADSLAPSGAPGAPAVPGAAATQPTP